MTTTPRARQHFLHVLKVGDLEMDLALRELRKDSLRGLVEPKVFDFIIFLIHL